MEPEPDISVIVLSWNTRDLLAPCLRSAFAALEGIHGELLVIDNASSDGSPDMVRSEFPEAKLVVNAANLGYAAGVNQGLARSRGRHLCLLGSDTEVEADVFSGLLRFLREHPAAGACAPALMNFDGTRQRACMRFPRLATALCWDTPLGAIGPGKRELDRYQMKDWNHEGTRLVDQPPGTCILIRREALDRTGPMDERLWLFFNDVDLCLRMARRGLEIWYVDGPRVFHHLGGSTRRYGDFAIEWHRNRIAYYRKHFGLPGAALAKAAMCFVAARQCWRIRRDLPSPYEWRSQSRQILGFMWRLLHA